MLVHLLSTLWFRVTWRAFAILAAMLGISLLTLEIEVGPIVDTQTEASLSLQSAQLQTQLRLGTGGAIEATDPIRRVYRDARGTLIYAVLDANGQVIDASGETARELLAGHQIHPVTRATYFDLTLEEDPPTTYRMLAEPASGEGDLIIVVGRGVPDEEIADLRMRDLAINHLEWIVALTGLAAMLAATWLIRSSLASIRRLGDQAHTLGPDSPGLRLPSSYVPPEVRQTVTAINQAFDRLIDAQESNRRFTAVLAHELRRPLATMTLQLEDMHDNPSASGLREDVHRMRRLVDQLMGMVRTNALTVSTADPVDLAEVARDVISSIAPSAARKHVRLSFHAPARPVTVRGDRLGIWLAVRNLVENAVQHAPPRSEVTIRAEDTGAIVVRDRGPGVPVADRDTIFKPFWRGTSAAKEGSGLGLAIVADVAAQHGGSVSVSDAPGGGALFTLTFPPAPET